MWLLKLIHFWLVVLTEIKIHGWKNYIFLSLPKKKKFITMTRTWFMEIIKITTYFLQVWNFRPKGLIYGNCRVVILSCHWCPGIYLEHLNIANCAFWNFLKDRKTYWSILMPIKHCWSSFFLTQHILQLHWHVGGAEDTALAQKCTSGSEI